MTIYDDSKMKFYEESNMILYSENREVKDYEIIDFHERNTTVSKFSNIEECLLIFRHKKSTKINKTA